MNIYEAIPKVSGEVEAIGRERHNRQQGFKYRGIDDLYNALGPVMAKHGVFSVPQVLSSEYHERTSKSGGVLIHARLTIQYTFWAADGSKVECVVVGEGMDSGDKAANKAMSVAHKYALTQTFNVRTENSDDPDAESHEVESGSKPLPRLPGANPPAAPTISRDEQVKLFALAHEKNWTDADVKAQLDALGLKASSELNDMQLQHLRKLISDFPKPKGNV